MTRPSECPHCGSRNVRAHTGTYCEDCGEPLAQDTIVCEDGKRRLTLDGALRLLGEQEAK